MGRRALPYFLAAALSLASGLAEARFPGGRNDCFCGGAAETEVLIVDPWGVPSEREAFSVEEIVDPWRERVSSERRIVPLVVNPWLI